MHSNLPQTVITKEIGNAKSYPCRAVVKNPAEETLIYAVYKRRPLWDPRVHFYRNNTVVKLLWDEVAQETGLPDAQARARWKSLRDYYRTELKKINKADGKEGRKVGWTYFQSMSFLEEVMNQSKSSNNEHSEQSDESLSAGDESIEAAESLLSISAKEQRIDLVNGEIKCANSYTDNNLKIENDSIKWEFVEELPIKQNIVVDSTSINSKDPAQTPGTRNPLKMRPNFDLMHKKLLIQLENRRLELLERAAKMEDDDDLLFFRSLLPMFKNLPESRKMWARLKFQEIVCKELDDLNQSSI